ncbi:MAG: 5-formyltetrahydrofolate cyclo-ligase [Actinomycetota bacterium]|nr:5-formyltetrahydrofolate cyclo-ligase [Actinomycetota bacterium]
MGSKAELRRRLQAQRQAMPDGDRRLAGRRLAVRGLAWASALGETGGPYPGAAWPADAAVRLTDAAGPNRDGAGQVPDPQRGGPSPSSPPGRIAAYLSGGTEPPTLVLLSRLVEEGYEILVPVCEAGFRLQWVRWLPGIELVRSRWAPVDEPVGKRLPLAVMEGVSGILLPALAADVEGNRLGKGGGYYDRFLATLDGLEHRPATAAVVFEHELLPAGRIEFDELDAPVDGVLTPDRYRAAAKRA